MTRWIRQTVAGIRALLQRRDRDHELDNELQAYLAASIDAKIAAGLNPAEAHRTAQAEMGTT